MHRMHGMDGVLDILDILVKKKIIIPYYFVFLRKSYIVNKKY
jgi:hypothetical protein